MQGRGERATHHRVLCVLAWRGTARKKPSPTAALIDLPGEHTLSAGKRGQKEYCLELEGPGLPFAVNIAQTSKFVGKPRVCDLRGNGELSSRLDRPMVAKR